jgi:hypothetical protein
VKRAANPRVPARQRALVYVTLALPWLSGIAWLLLHYFGSTPGDFGPVPHPLEGLVDRIHGLVAQAALLGLGWFGALHARLGRPERRRRSGWLLLALLGVVIVSGSVQLYLSGDEGSQWLVLLHEALGAALLLPALLHWWPFSRARGRAEHPAHDVRARSAGRNARS